MNYAFRSSFLTTVAVLTVAFTAGGAASADDLSALSPDKWPRAEYELTAARTFSPMSLSAEQKPPRVASGVQGMVVGSSEALAVHAGVKALQAGGTAMDAVATTALAQITLDTGAIISFAGINTLVYYENKTGKTYSMNATFNTVINEIDPMSIPPSAQQRKDTPMSELFASNPYSGRAVLTPGFMAGIEAAHQRFGKLPFKALFIPSIHWAEKGFPVTQMRSYMMGAYKDILAKQPAAKAIFFGPDGNLLPAGATLRQLALAETLRHVADEGARYMYNGAWAQHFVDQVRGDGGKMTLDDLKSYKVIWEEPTRVAFNGYEIVTSGRASVGGPSLGGAFMLLNEADLAKSGPYERSGGALYSMMEIAQYSAAPAKAAGMSAERYQAVYGNFPATNGYLLDPEHAKRTWQGIADGSLVPRGSLPMPKTPGHSAAIIAVDQWGNVAAMVQSINANIWGGGGVFVDGVSVSDSGWFQQYGIIAAGPGNRLADPMAPTIVLKNGKPVFATSTIGGGLHEKTLQVLYKMLVQGEAPDVAITSPAFHRPDLETLTGPGPATQIVTADEFDASVIAGVRSKGLAVKEVTPAQTGLSKGFIIVAAIDPKGSGVKGAADPTIPTGMAEGYPESAPQ